MTRGRGAQHGERALGSDNEPRCHRTVPIHQVIEPLAPTGHTADRALELSAGPAPPAAQLPRHRK